MSDNAEITDSRESLPLHKDPNTEHFLHSSLTHLSSGDSEVTRNSLTGRASNFNVAKAEPK